MFKSKRHPVFNLLLLGFPLVCIPFTVCAGIILLSSISEPTMILIAAGGFLIVIGLLAMMMYTWMRTEYHIVEQDLWYRIGFWKGSIAIHDIHSIREAGYPSSSLQVRPALDFVGLSIRYGSGYSIFMSPENPEDFVASLMRVNPQIIKK